MASLSPVLEPFSAGDFEPSVWQESSCTGQGQPSRGLLKKVFCKRVLQQWAFHLSLRTSAPWHAIVPAEPLVTLLLLFRVSNITSAPKPAEGVDLHVLSEQ